MLSEDAAESDNELMSECHVAPGTPLTGHDQDGAPQKDAIHDRDYHGWSLKNKAWYPQRSFDAGSLQAASPAYFLCSDDNNRTLPSDVGYQNPVAGVLP